MSRTESDFTYSYYRSLLGILQSFDYQAIGFADSDTQSRTAARAVLIRHDIDYVPSSIAPISAIEATLGVRGTYFFQTESRFYTLEDSATREALRRVVDDGHWIGLHFDATRIQDDSAALIGVELAAKRLEDLTSLCVSAVSFHMPGHRPVGHLRLHGGRVNTYSERFYGAIEYLSDSNQSWRGKDPIEVISRQPDRLQMLTHPEWWRADFVPFDGKIRELARRFGLSVEELVTVEQTQRLAADSKHT